MIQKTGKIEKAADKVQLIAPLLNETLSTADRVDLQKRIAAEAGLSYRSIGRYVERFRKRKLPGWGNTVLVAFYQRPDGCPR